MTHSINPKIDTYLAEGCGRCPLGGTPNCKVHNWQQELATLRMLVLECGLTEELKWDVPCYTFQSKNILIVAAFKEYAALSFFKGALLQDSEKLLKQHGENSQAVRLFRFTNVSEIIELEPILKAYIFEAIEIEKAGFKVEFKKNPEPFPQELLDKFAENTAFKTAFERLTAGRQRGYILYFSAPKQSKTRTERIEKWLPTILEGKGMTDDYRK
jgi:uncharacterized protein YdeI (YjbR/CyaY-like superfamily)